MKNKTKQIEKAFVKLMTDMGATFVDVTPEKKQTDHNPDIVKKVDWDQRIEKFRHKHEGTNTGGAISTRMMDSMVYDIKQLLFKYGLWIIEAGEKEDQRQKNKKIIK